MILFSVLILKEFIFENDIFSFAYTLRIENENHDVCTSFIRYVALQLVYSIIKFIHV